MIFEAMHREFILENNRIEGITHEPKPGEILAHLEVLDAPKVNTLILEKYVAHVQPGARLRVESGMDVRVGSHVPPPGGPHIRADLADLLARKDMDAYERHVAYETLHPFTDGNGRSGRVLWLHDMGGIEQVPLGFLHTFYYQALQHSKGRH